MNSTKNTVTTGDLMIPVAFPPSAAPFGYVQCTCDKYPKVIYLNEQMRDYLDINNAPESWIEFLTDNVFFMVPYMDRDKFRSYLDEAPKADEPIRIIHRIIKADGSLSTVMGWLGLVSDSDGHKAYSIIYTDLDADVQEMNPEMKNSYFRALESAYNIIFEINTALNTVECLFGKDTSDLGKLYDVRMTIESAMNFWLNNYIVEEDRANMRRYFERILTISPEQLQIQPVQAEFRIRWEDGMVYSFIGVAILHDSTSILFCCRDIANVQYSSLIARELQSYRKFRGFIDRYLAAKSNIRGTVIFTKSDNGTCHALYCTQRLLDILGIRYDQYLMFMEEGFPFEMLDQIARKHGVNTFLDLAEGKIDSIRLLDHGKYYNVTYSHIFDSSYGLYFTADGIPAVVAGIPQKGIFARTFGHFDLFVDGNPVIFSNSKEKELLALLIDRHGGTLTSAEAISYLWEDSILTERLRTRFRKLAMGLRRTLEQYGIDYILINHNGVRSIDPSMILCDYYELLAGNTDYVQSFHNSYMTDYNWGETTLGTLWDYS